LFIFHPDIHPVNGHSVKIDSRLVLCYNVTGYITKITFYIMTRSKSNSVTIRDVARRAGVSVATVSRYINRTVTVSDETSARVLAAMSDLNFTPLSAARKLATKRSYTLGLILADMHGDFFAPLLSGIEAQTSQAGYDLLISTSRRIGPHRELPLGPHNSDGLLVFAGSLSNTELDRFYKDRFPLVLIHQTPPPGMQIPCVTVENKDASRKIVEHLILSHSRRRIVFLRGPEKEEDTRWRESGYRAALEVQGIPFEPALVTQGEFSRYTAYASIKDLIARQIEFDGVFSGDDEAAVGVLAALAESGKVVPQDVSVVGFDDQRMAAYLSLPLTTVRAPTEAVGRVAAQCLVQLIQTGQTDPLTLLPTEIVIRSSCGCGQYPNLMANGGEFSKDVEEEIAQANGFRSA
jgi:LacI family transcriptional regulator